MSFVAETMVSSILKTLAKSKAQFARRVRSLVEARRRRIEHDRQFYRNLKAYCRVNNLSPHCEDDWKTAACDKPEDNLSIINTKGNVS